MIQPRELMIGNYVENGEYGTIETVKSIEYESGAWFINGEQIDMWHPIPLAEDWLIKLGVKLALRNDISEDYWYELRVLNWLILYRLYKGSLLEFTIEADGGDFNNGSFDLKKSHRYVHQLQNLYFSLCGEELKKYKNI